MVDAGLIVLIIVLVIVGGLFIFGLYKSINVVREKQAVVIERLGKFKATLSPGIHFIIPYLDWPRTFTHRYYLSDNFGRTTLKQYVNETKISQQNEVLDFPRQEVITRDNATITLDALLSYQIVNPKVMLYSTKNLPRMLAKLLQAQLRNVAGTLDVDQMIESTAGLSRVGAEMQHIANRWGVHVKFVKIQNVNAGELRDVLQRKKNADLNNKQVLISAKADKQKMITRAEGERDSMQNQAQGESQAERARARGDAKAIINGARAEAESVREVARAIGRTGENPTKYLLALKYIKALQKVMWQNGTSIRLLPNQTAFLQTVQGFGLNTIMPSQNAK